jgi:hypothetical protein
MSDCYQRSGVEKVVSQSEQIDKALYMLTVNAHMYLLSCGECYDIKGVTDEGALDLCVHHFVV